MQKLCTSYASNLLIIAGYYVTSSRPLVTLEPTGDQVFRGFLIQARQMTDDTTIVGSFSDFSNGARLSSCDPSDVRVTIT